MTGRGKISVLFVCMGNICRSPTAEGVFRRRVAQAGLEHAVRVDSAGTHDYHVGEAPDPRARQAATKRGYDIGGLLGRQVVPEDFATHDYILAMDRDNLAALLRLCPAEHRDKVRLFLAYSRKYPGHEVPDPYFGGRQGFDWVLDMVEDGAAGLIEEIRRRLG
jgi:low molecular weight protein-tyrosine phosphatase